MSCSEQLIAHGLWHCDYIGRVHQKAFQEHTEQVKYSKLKSMTNEIRFKTQIYQIDTGHPVQLYNIYIGSI